MKRTGLSIVLILLLLVLWRVPAEAVSRSQVRTKATLLSLYRQSDAILVARFDKRIDDETTRVGEGYAVVNVKTYYDISSVIKGDARKFLVLEDEEYRYQIPPSANGDAPREAVFVQDIENFDPEGQPTPGDTVLLFLKRNGTSLELADDRDGVRKVEAGDVGIYINRIEELSSIFDTKNVEPSDVTEWLVRCAAEPATRWDGAYALLDGFRRLERAGRKDSEGDRRQRTVLDNAEFARLLTDRQKVELASILIYRKGIEPKLLRGDKELIELVKRWGGSVYASSILDQLRSGGLAPADNAFLMNTLAGLVDDVEMTQLARAYTRSAFSIENASHMRPHGDTQSYDNRSQVSVLKKFVALCARVLAVDEM